jgi:thiamine biosynthesis protein ThiS
MGRGLWTTTAIMNSRMPLRILLNGEPRDLDGPLTVSTLLAKLGIDARLVAVEVNRRVIRRAQHEATDVPDGAEVEIVSFVGGGRA